MPAAALDGSASSDRQVPFQRRFSTFFVVAALAVVIVIVLGVRLAVAVHRKRTAVEIVERLGGECRFAPLEFDSLRKYFGEDWLKPFDRLTSVDLHDTDASDETLQVLSGMTDLEELDLDGTQITDAGIAHLQELVKLKSLSVSRTSIGNAGLEPLVFLLDLKVLYLARTRVTEAGLTRLKRAFPALDIWKLAEKGRPKSERR
jgi:hypothetical protein